MLRVPRNRSKAQTDRQGGKVARAKVTVTSDYPALKSGGGGPGNHSKRLEKQPKGEAYYELAPHWTSADSGNRFWCTQCGRGGSS